jgi:hypothetical protein
VAAGEYLSKIAAMYSTTVEALVALNEWLQKEVRHEGFCTLERCSNTCMLA